MADPHGARELRGVADEPQVGVVVGRAGLAGDGLVHRQRRRRAAAVGDDTLEHVGRRRGDLGRDRLGAGGGVLVDDVAVAVEDLGDGGGLHVGAGVRERGVGRRHVEHRDGRGAQGQRVDGLEVALDAEGVCDVDDGLRADLVDDLRIGGVDRLPGRVLEADRAIAHVVVVVDRVPAADADAAVAVHEHRGVHARLDRRRERHRLERRARLAFRLRGEVPLALVGARAAHHGLDLAGRRVDGDQGALEPVVPRVADVLVDGRLGGALHRRADGRLDGEAAVVDGARRELLAQLAQDVAHEGGVLVGAGRLARSVVEHERLGDGGVVLLLGDVAAVEHVGEHGVAALEGKVGVDRGVVGGGRLRQADEGRGLGEREVGAGLVEVGLGRRLDAVAVAPEEDGVEIHHEYLVFAVHLLELQGDVGLAHLARERLLELLVLEHRVADELLGDGRRALAAAGDLHHDGAQDAAQVDALVRVEALVLGVDEPLEHVGGALVDGDGDTVLLVVFGDDVAVGVEDRGGRRDQVGVGVGVVGQVLEPRPHEVDAGDHERRDEGEGQEESAQGDELADARLGRPADLARTCGHKRYLRMVVEPPLSRIGTANGARRPFGGAFSTKGLKDLRRPDGAQGLFAGDSR